MLPQRKWQPVEARLKPFTVRDELNNGEIAWIVGGLLVVGGGYLVGRWWKKRRQAAAQAAKPSAYVQGADILGMTW